MKKITLEQLIKNELLALPETSISFHVKEFDNFRESLDKKGGIYIFKRGQDILYIGISKNLDRRLNQHISVNEKGNKQIGDCIRAGQDITVSIMFEPNKVYQEFYESYLIQIHQPIYNTKKLGQTYHVEGENMGRPTKLTEADKEKLKEMYYQGHHTVGEILKRFKISKATLYRHIN